MHVTFTLAEDLMAVIYALPEDQPLTASMARYLLSVAQAVAEGHTLETTSTCSECGQTPDVDDAEHLCMQLADGKTFVVIGCEGYWFIDPASVGLFGTSWQPRPELEPVDPPRRMQNEPGS